MANRANNPCRLKVRHCSSMVNEMGIKFIFAWYALWIGAYWDCERRRLYILPIPCCGLILCFGEYDLENWDHFSPE